MEPLRVQDGTNDFSELAKEVVALRAQIAELKESERFWQERAEKFKEEKRILKSGVGEQEECQDGVKVTNEQDTVASEELSSKQKKISNLITGTSSKGNSSEWELARELFVQDIDKQEIGGVIDSVIENIEAAYTSKISGKDREWIRNHLKVVAAEIHANNKELVVSKIGHSVGNLEDLRSGIDVVNLLPVFGNAIAMQSIIELAKKNEIGELNEPEEVASLLESLLAKAKSTKTSL
jgi:hypothetical protein